MLDQFRFLTFGWRDAIEILVVAYGIYRLLLLIHGTRAVQMLIGIVVLVFTYALAVIFKFAMIAYLLGLLFPYGAIAAIVIFQPELRAALARLGQSPVARLFKPMMEASEVAEEIADAVERLSRSGIGCIIAIEREVALGDYVASGTAMQAKVSADLLATIFTPYSPLHDGAVIIRGDTIIGAGAILPLSQAPIDRALGTRHRAAIGLSEETDALVIVVSEETAQISVAREGRLTRGLTAPQVRDIIAGRAPRTTGEQPVLRLRA